LLLGGALLSCVVLAGLGLWVFSTQPMYAPGDVRGGRGLSAPLTPPAQPNDSATWCVEPEIELAHFAVGDGRNVLMVHGGPGMPFAEPMAGLEPLTDHFRFHYYDQRGSGESTRPFDRFDSSNTFENMARLERTLGLGAQIADIERIRRILGEERLVLIGHSWGGLLASLYAAEFPEHVAGLILIAPASMLVLPPPEGGSDLFESVRARLPEDQQAAFEAYMDEYMEFGGLFAKSEQDLIDLNARFGAFYAQVVDTIPIAQGRPGGWMVWAQYVSMGQRHDYRRALAAVSAPVLVLHGADDLQSEAASRLYAEAFPRSEFVVIEDAGHFMFEEQPETFSAVVEDFLGRLP
jgi:proline iminopeptidase